jgi:hypothetical protein
MSSLLLCNSVATTECTQHRPYNGRSTEYKRRIRRDVWRSGEAYLTAILMQGLQESMKNSVRISGLQQGFEPGPLEWMSNALTAVSKRCMPWIQKHMEWEDYAASLRQKFGWSDWEEVPTQGSHYSICFQLRISVGHQIITILTSLFDDAVSIQTIQRRWQDD